MPTPLRTFSDAARIFSINSLCWAWVPCEKFSRTTSIPAANNRSNISWLLLAGPSVQTIFARLICPKAYQVWFPVLLFKKRFHQGLVDGTVTLTVRLWEKPHVKPGGRYRVHPIGVVEVDAIARIPFRDLTAADAVRAGFTGLDELTEYARPAAKGPFTALTPVFKVELHHGGDGDRVQIAMDTKLDAPAVAELCRKLARMDGKQPWTRKTLALISRRPKIAASKLAASLGRPTEPFKIDVRKLKKLGLTQSFEVGYGLSPRGRAFLRRQPRW